MKTRSLAPKQARSKASLQRLMIATQSVIEKYGVEGATVAMIANEADLSPTVLYQRFRDKEELLEAVFRHVMDSQEEMLRNLTDEQMLRGLPLAEFTARTFRSLLLAYRFRGKFLNAARNFAQTSGTRSFARRVERFELLGYRHAIALMLQRRSEIAHPEPELAVTVGLSAVIGAIRERCNWRSRSWAELFPSDESLIAHLTSLFLTNLRRPGVPNAAKRHD